MLIMHCLTYTGISHVVLIALTAEWIPAAFLATVGTDRSTTIGALGDRRFAAQSADITAARPRSAPIAIEIPLTAIHAVGHPCAGISTVGLHPSRQVISRKNLLFFDWSQNPTARHGPLFPTGTSARRGLVWGPSHSNLNRVVSQTTDAYDYEHAVRQPFSVCWSRLCNRTQPSQHFQSIAQCYLFGIWWFWKAVFDLIKGGAMCRSNQFEWFSGVNL